MFANLCYHFGTLMNSKTSFSHSASFQTLPKEILSILLLDRTTGRNILWATDDYSPIPAKSEIKIEQITGENSERIKPRVQKQKSEQASRTRNKAEVFTPSWICNEQNNLVDEAWFARKNAFNFPDEKNPQKWISTKEKIIFDENPNSKKTWRDYVNATRLEITCGEAPYLTSRYDTVTGARIKISDRIGLLDRKLRVVRENAQSEDEYFLWTKTAYQNCYGFELQGDNLFLARTNLLLTFIESTDFFLQRKPTEAEQMEIAEIISWNLWQMDGLTFKTPFSADGNEQPSLFAEFNEQENFPCKIMDWKENKIVQYKSLAKGR